MDCNRQPLHDLRVLLNSRAKSISTKNCNNEDLTKEIVITIHNDKTTNKRPVDVSRDINPKKKINKISSTPVLRYNQIFNTKVTEYIENSQKVTNAYHQYLAASLSLEYVNRNIQKSQLNAYKSVTRNENHSQIEHSQIVYNKYENILKTIPVENNIINNTKSSNCLLKNTVNKMDTHTRNYQNVLNINSDIILLPNAAPTSRMQERMDEALEAIMYIISNNIVTQQSITKSDLKLFSPTLRNVISDRIINVLTGHPVRSRSDIIDRYLKRYPKEIDIELFNLYKTRPGTSCKLYLIPTDNPKNFFRVNMMRLINTKMKKIIAVVENTFKNSKRQLLRLKKPTKTNNPNYTIQKCVYYNQYTNCLVEGEFSRLLAKFKNQIVHMILNKETAQLIQLNILQK